MPTYEYKCPAGHVFEKFFPTMNDRRRVKCPTCGKRAERLISGGAGLVFKGSGFYATDYKQARTEPAKAKQPSESQPADAKPAESKAADSSKPKKDSGDK